MCVNVEAYLSPNYIIKVEFTGIEHLVILFKNPLDIMTDLNLY